MKKMPVVVSWLYPELERIGPPKLQWEVLLTKAHVYTWVFAGIVILGAGFLADWIEDGFRWFGIVGASGDLAAFGAFALTMLLVLWVLMFFSTRGIRRGIRAELVLRGELICVPCGYDLRGQTEPRCPECGSRFRRHCRSCGQRHEGLDDDCPWCGLAFRSEPVL